MTIYALILTFILGGVTFLGIALALIIRDYERDVAKKKAAHPSTMTLEEQADLAIKEIFKQ